MATVRLERYEVKQRLLPPVCMKCGADAVLERRKKFGWYSPWLNFLLVAHVLIWAIVITLVTKRKTVYAPLCNQHKSHWSWRAWYIWVGLTLTGIFGAATFVLMFSIERGPTIIRAIPAFSCVAAAIFGAGWLISAAVIQRVGIRAIRITDRDITLTNVSPYFCEALERERYYREGGDEYQPYPTSVSTPHTVPEDEDDGLWERERE